MRPQFACAAPYFTAIFSPYAYVSHLCPSVITTGNEGKVWHYLAIMYSERCWLGDSSVRRRKLCHLWRMSIPLNFLCKQEREHWKERGHELKGDRERVNLLWHFGVNTSVCQNNSARLWLYRRWPPLLFMRQIYCTQVQFADSRTAAALLYFTVWLNISGVFLRRKLGWPCPWLCL